MKTSDSVYGEKWMYAALMSFLVPSLRPAFGRCVPSIFFNFFYRQYHAAFFKGRIKVTGVDHPLDEKIPFNPAWVTIYLDFIYYWIRMLSFFLRRYGRKSYAHVKDFIFSMGKLYAYAAEVYSKNMSTTKRPFYIARPRFFLIHLVDPHLMCIPSLHVMVVIHTFTMFEKIARSLGDGYELKEQAAEMKQGALAISAAILFVKQHSVNCISAAMYAMTSYNYSLFPPEEAKAFTDLLFSAAPSSLVMPKGCGVHPAAAPSIRIPQEDQAQIKAHIFSLYNRFLEEGKSAKSWEEPLLNFLKTYKLFN
ncbi:MAG: hypothetical protein LBH16_07905 [Treponema sp.]|nr:hypothetical protein [Treponema sp.]